MQRKVAPSAEVTALGVVRGWGKALLHSVYD
jgi:hypothetical protein